MNAVSPELTTDLPEARRIPFGILAYLGAGISIVFCFVQVIVPYLLAIIGVHLGEFDLNPHLQAVLMWSFALLGVAGLFVDRPLCGSTTPFALGVLSILVILATLYGRYSMPVLMSAYMLLIIAAFLNQALRLRTLNRQVAVQAESLRTLNITLEERVREQVAEIEQLGRLKRFLAPPVAELLINDGDETRLASHRSHVAALFCDIRGFTAFTGSAEPEEVMGVLAAYHGAMGRLADRYRATIDHRAGDGLMLFFNDPIPCEEPEAQAVELALEMRDAFDGMNGRWKRLGYELGFSIGIASGYATMGIVGYEGRYDYTANGQAINLAARLCDHAVPGQILVSRRVAIEVEHRFTGIAIGELSLKGVRDPVEAFEIRGLGT